MEQLSENFILTNKTMEQKPNQCEPTFKAWEEKNLTTQLEIMSHLDNQEADTIRKYETSNEIWTHLKNELEPKNRWKSSYEIKY